MAIDSWHVEGKGNSKFRCDHQAEFVLQIFERLKIALRNNVVVLCERLWPALTIFQKCRKLKSWCRQKKLQSFTTMLHFSYFNNKCPPWMQIFCCIVSWFTQTDLVLGWLWGCLKKKLFQTLYLLWQFLRFPWG